MNQGDSSQDERSDSQKKKHIIQQKQSLSSQRKAAPPVDTFETATKKTLARPAQSLKKPTLKKTDSPRSTPPSSPRINPQRPVPPKDEWTF